MNHRSRASSAFSLVEVVLALGVAAFCLIAVLGMLPVGLKTQQASVNQTKANAIISQIIDDLRADVRLPPGQASKAEGEWVYLHARWAAVAKPDTLYFTNDGYQTGILNQSPAPSEAVFAATVKYLSPPTVTTSMAKITVAWPAASVSINPGTQEVDLSNVTGSIDMFAAVNRQ
jgi:uncharacterized protein (TIGR02598 family)